MFAETEAWQNGHYEFEAADRDIPDYSYAYKQLTCCHTWFRHVAVLTLTSVLEDAAPGTVTVIGLPADAKAMVDAYTGGKLTVPARPSGSSNRLINFAILTLNLVYGAAFAIMRLKPFGVSPQSVFLAADYLYDPRDVRLYQEVKDGGPVLLVYRVVPPDLDKFPELKNHISCKI